MQPKAYVTWLTSGSERLSKTKSEGQVAKEAQFINKSLSFLEQVIVALGYRRREHVPYRSSKLTHLLKDSLGGNCKTVMIANVCGETQHVSESLATFKFASRMMRVSNEAVVNVKIDNYVLIRKYEREIKHLKQELAMHDNFNSHTKLSYNPYTESQRLALRSQVIQFLRGDVLVGDTEEQDELAPLELVNVRHMREILLQCRHVYKHGGGSYTEPKQEPVVASHVPQHNASTEQPRVIDGNDQQAPPIEVD